MASCLGLVEQVALARAQPCYDFATPAFEKSLDPAKVRRLSIQVENPGSEAKEAAAALGMQVRQRGIEPVTNRGSVRRAGESEQQAAERICRRNDTQMVATVRFLTGSTPAVAIEFRDATGQVVGRLTTWRTDDTSCVVAEALVSPYAAGPPPSMSWYGYQLMLGDAASLALLFTPLPPVGFLFYLIAPVATHASNGQGTTGAASLGIRLVLPLVGFMIGGSTDQDNCESDPCGLGGMIAGFGLGMLAAILIDDVGLAWKPAEGDTREPESNASSDPRRAELSISLSAAVIPYRAGAGLGLLGRF
jgi:hypothetical protein